VEIIHAGVEELLGEGVYDFIISGLPLNNFPVALVRKIFQAYNRLLKPGGTLSYYEYVLIRQLKTPFVNRRERRRLYRVGRVVGKYIRAHQIRRQRVFMNVPPAVVRHLRLKPSPNGAEQGRLINGTDRSLHHHSSRHLSILL
jgi:phospholipid N-methyltransferase